MPIQRVAILVLAAGGSSRMGTVKQLLSVEGQSMLRRAATVAVSVPCRPVVVVLGRDAGRLRGELFGLDVMIVENPEWSAGMGGSIGIGLAAALAADPDLSGVAVTLCDQPYVGVNAVGQLLAAFKPTLRAVAARYSDTLGVPAVFGRATFDALLALEPGTGARRLLGGEGVVGVDLPEAAVDVDTPEDYKRIGAAETPPQ